MKLVLNTCKVVASVCMGFLQKSINVIVGQSVGVEAEFSLFDNRGEMLMNGVQAMSGFVEFAPNGWNVQHPRLKWNSSRGWVLGKKSGQAVQNRKERFVGVFVTNTERQLADYIRNCTLQYFRWIKWNILDFVNFASQMKAFVLNLMCQGRFSNANIPKNLQSELALLFPSISSGIC